MSDIDHAGKLRAAAVEADGLRKRLSEMQSELRSVTRALARFRRRTRAMWERAVDRKREQMQNVVQQRDEWKAKALAHRAAWAEENSNAEHWQYVACAMAFDNGLREGQEQREAEATEAAERADDESRERRRRLRDEEEHAPWHEAPWEVEP